MRRSNRVSRTMLIQFSMSQAADQMWRGASCEYTDKRACKKKVLKPPHRSARTVSNPNGNAKATSNLQSSNILLEITHPSNIRILLPSSAVTPMIKAIHQASYRILPPLMEASTSTMILPGRHHFRTATLSDGRMTTQNTRMLSNQILTGSELAGLVVT